MNMGEETNVNKSRRVAFDNNIEPDVECRICLESLVDDDRTPVKLRCGHEYHLAFNVKNMMQCPTCKRVEHGKWLFARSSPSPDFNVPLVQPLMGGLPAPVWPDMLTSLDIQLARRFLNPASSTSSAAFNLPRRESSVEMAHNVPLVQPVMGGLPAPVWREPIVTSVERQLGMRIPTPARFTSSGTFNVPRRESSVEMTQPQQIAAPVWRESMLTSVETELGRRLRTPARYTSSSTFNVPRRESSVEMTQQQQIAANISRTLAAKEHNIRCTMYGNDIRSSGGEGGSYSRGRGSSAEGMATAERATRMKRIATANGGDTSRSGGSKQFRPMA